MHRQCIRFSNHMLFYKFAVQLVLVILDKVFTVGITLLLHVYIFSEHSVNVVERKTLCFSYVFVT